MSKKKKDKGSSKKNKKNKELRVGASPPLAQVSFAQTLGVSDPLQAGRIDGLLHSLADIKTYADPANASVLANEFHKELSGAFTGKDYGSGAWSILGVPDVFGFRGFSSQFTQVFGGSVWSVFAWIAENYWPVVDAMGIFDREILSDGYRLEGGTKQEQERARQVCTALNMKRLRCDIFKSFKLYGNVFFEPIRNGLKGIKQIKPLLPAYIRPIPTFDGQNIKEWQVQKGAYYKIYKRDDLLYATFKKSTKNYDIGVPPLGAVLVDIESAVSADSFLCSLMQKGGLYGVAVLLEGSANGQGRGKGPSAYAQYLQAALQANHSGNRAAYETVVFENAKDVKVMNKLSELDTPFQTTGDTAAKKTAHVLGLPHELLGIITNANQQYHPSSLLDFSMKQLDKTIMEGLDYTDSFINKKLFPLYGVKNVRIVASPRYNSVTRVAAQALGDLAGIQDLLSINEGRVNYLGLAPIPDGDRSLTRLMLDGGVKGGEGGAGAQPAKPIEPNPFPPMLQDVEEGASDEDLLN